jgi:peptidoglycan hydrolase CwlO-like protein
MNTGKKQQNIKSHLISLQKSMTRILKELQAGYKSIDRSKVSLTELNKFDKQIEDLQKQINKVQAGLKKINLS